MAPRHVSIPTGSITATSIGVGWMLMALSFVMAFAGPQHYQPITGEFLSYVPRWLFCGLMLVSGFFIAKPGAKRRVLKHGLGAFCCVWWIGVGIWPWFTGSNTPISVPGIIIWATIGGLLVNDALSPAYDPRWQSSDDA